MTKIVSTELQTLEAVTVITEQKPTNAAYPCKIHKGWNYHKDTMSAYLQALNHANDPMIRHHPICILLQVQIASWTQYDAPSACNCGPFTNLDITAILPQTARGGGAAGSRGSLSTRP